MNLPAVGIMIAVTIVLVIGIRESAFFNALMVAIKLGVVLLVIAVGVGYINRDNWMEIPQEARRQRAAGGPNMVTQRTLDRLRL